MPSTKLLPIRPCPVSNSNESLCSNGSNGSRTVVRTSKNWVLPPRPKPGRKSCSGASKRSHKCVSKASHHSSISGPSSVTHAAANIVKGKMKSASVSATNWAELIGLSETDACLSTKMKQCSSLPPPLNIKNSLANDDFELGFLKFEDDEVLRGMKSMDEPVPTITTTALRTKTVANLSMSDFSLANSPTSETPNSLFSSDHYILSNESFDVPPNVEMVQEKDKRDKLLDNFGLNFNMELIDPSTSRLVNEVPLNFDPDYISPTLEEIMDEQDTNNLPTSNNNQV